MVSSFFITSPCALLPTLVYFKPLEGEKGGRQTEDGLVAVNSVDNFFFVLFTTSSVSPTGGGGVHETRHRMKESSECVIWKGDNKDTEALQSVEGRNGDQYRTTLRKKKKAGREADGGREAWRTDRRSERAKDGHSLTVEEGGREGGGGNKSNGEKGWMR